MNLAAEFWSLLIRSLSSSDMLFRTQGSSKGSSSFHIELSLHIPSSNPKPG